MIQKNNFMIRTIKKEIENYLERLNDTQRPELIFHISMLLQQHIYNNNIYGFNIICDNTNNIESKDKNIIDIYIKEYKYSSVIDLNIIHIGSKILKLRKLRKKKLEQIYGTI